MAANTIITPTWNAREVARVASNSTKFVGAITRKLSDEFMVSGTKVGATVGLRLPQRFVTTKGQALQPQAIVDQVVPVTITDQANIGYGWSSFSETLELQDMYDRYVNPAGYQLAKTAGMGIRSNRDIGRVTAGEIVEFVDAQIKGVDADCIFLSCTNWQAIDAIAPVTARLGLPVISSNQAAIAAVRARMAGAHPLR